MGYDLHITRAEDWDDSESAPIDLDEWEVVVESDPQLQFSGDQVNDQRLVEWEGSEGCLWWDHGQIVSKHPDEALIVKMVAISKRLGASVQGDDGEHYPLEENEGARSHGGCLFLSLVIGASTASALLVGH